jgi:hypothetical protein
MCCRGHTIPSPGANAQASSFIVTGKKVSQAIPSCELVTTAYWFDNTNNKWEEIRNDEDGTTVRHLEPNNMYMEWKPTQHDFQYDLLNQFGIAGVVNQDHVNIRVKFETFDLSDPTKFVEDIVTLKVNGNG